MQKLRHHLSPSMVVSLVALFVALSGVAVAGVTLSNNSVRSNNIVNGQVKNADLATNSVGKLKIKSNAVDSSKILDGSIGITDLSTATRIGLTGPKGDPGAIGPIGTATSGPIYAPAATYAPVPGMTVNYVAPAGTTTLLVTYSAACRVRNVTGSTGYDQINARVKVDGVVAEPAAGTEFVMCMLNLGQPAEDSMVGASMQRVAKVGPGPHTVTVEAQLFQDSATAPVGALWKHALSVVSGS